MAARPKKLARPIALVSYGLISYKQYNDDGNDDVWWSEITVKVQ